MLKTILSVTGKPGLYKLISSGKNTIIVESLTEKRRIPIYARDKVVSLGDIAMYTDEDEVPLKDVLANMKTREKGQKASVLPTASPDELRSYLSDVLPNFDRNRIYNSDIKKLISWYNILIETNIDFETEENKETEAFGENVTEESKPELQEPKAAKEIKTEEIEKKKRTRKPIAKKED